MVAAEDDRVIEAVRRGHTEAFGDIVRKYQKTVFNIMYRSTGSQDEAADLTQDAFLRAFDRLHTYRSGKNFYSWLYALAMNVARDHLRKRQRQPAMEHRDVDNTVRFVAPDEAETATHRSIDIQSLWAVLRTLSLNDREAVLLRFRDGMKMKEIAECLNLSVSGAKMRVHRGLKKLQDAWEYHYDERQT
ncbi:MAG: sigma-70 family RNA polymerase sigma factor [Desulfobacterales bacterium]|jgi:RNA polymerase sigma-70 factor (ECF subfamily)